MLPRGFKIKILRNKRGGSHMGKYSVKNKKQKVGISGQPSQ